MSYFSFLFLLVESATMLLVKAFVHTPITTILFQKPQICLTRQQRNRSNNQKEKFNKRKSWRTIVENSRIRSHKLHFISNNSSVVSCLHIKYNMQAVNFWLCHSNALDMRSHLDTGYPSNISYNRCEISYVEHKTWWEWRTECLYECVGVSTFKFNTV